MPILSFIWTKITLLKLNPAYFLETTSSVNNFRVNTDVLITRFNDLMAFKKGESGAD